MIYKKVVLDMNNKSDVYVFSDFIGKNSLSTIGACSTIVGGVTQLIKQFVPIHPLAICFLCATVISIIKLLLSNDYSKNNVLLAIVNIIPIALTASGGYDLINKISS